MAKTAEQIQRAYELVDFLREHPEQHDQDFWLEAGPGVPGEAWPLDAADVFKYCGTTACAAGWTVLLAGQTIDKGEAKVVQYRASVLLGLTSDEAHRLFFQADSLDEVCVEIELIFGPRPMATVR